MVGVAIMLPPYSLWFVKGDGKGWNEGSRKLLCIVLCEKTVQKVSLNPECLVLATLL